MMAGRRARYQPGMYQAMEQGRSSVRELDSSGIGRAKDSVPVKAAARTAIIANKTQAAQLAAAAATRTRSRSPDKGRKQQQQPQHNKIRSPGDRLTAAAAAAADADDPDFHPDLAAQAATLLEDLIADTDEEEDLGPDQFKCPKCSKVLTKKGSYMHMNMHRKEEEEQQQQQQQRQLCGSSQSASIVSVALQVVNRALPASRQTVECYPLLLNANPDGTFSRGVLLSNFEQLGRALGPDSAAALADKMLLREQIISGTGKSAKKQLVAVTDDQVFSKDIQHQCSSAEVAMDLDGNPIVNFFLSIAQSEQSSQATTASRARQAAASKDRTKQWNKQVSKAGMAEAAAAQVSAPLGRGSIKDAWSERYDIVPKLSQQILQRYRSNFSNEETAKTFACQWATMVVGQGHLSAAGTIDLDSPVPAVVRGVMNLCKNKKFRDDKAVVWLKGLLQDPQQGGQSDDPDCAFMNEDMEIEAELAAAAKRTHANAAAAGTSTDAFMGAAAAAATTAETTGRHTGASQDLDRTLQQRQQQQRQRLMRQPDSSWRQQHEYEQQQTRASTQSAVPAPTHLVMGNIVSNVINQDGVVRKKVFVGGRAVTVVGEKAFNGITWPVVKYHRSGPVDWEKFYVPSTELQPLPGWTPPAPEPSAPPPPGFSGYGPSGGGSGGPSSRTPAAAAAAAAGGVMITKQVMNLIRR